MNVRIIRHDLRICPIKPASASPAPRKARLPLGTEINGGHQREYGADAGEDCDAERRIGSDFRNRLEKDDRYDQGKNNEITTDNRYYRTKSLIVCMDFDPELSHRSREIELQAGDWIPGRTVRKFLEVVMHKKGLIQVFRIFHHQRQ